MTTMGTAAGHYYVDQLRVLPDDTIIWGVRRPDGKWRNRMGAEDFYVSRTDADRVAAELNQINGLASAVEQPPCLHAEGASECGQVVQGGRCGAVFPAADRPPVAPGRGTELFER